MSDNIAKRSGLFARRVSTVSERSGLQLGELPNRDNAVRFIDAEIEAYEKLAFDILEAEGYPRARRLFRESKSHRWQEQLPGDRRDGDHVYLSSVAKRENSADSRAGWAAAILGHTEGLRAELDTCDTLEIVVARAMQLTKLVGIFVSEFQLGHLVAPELSARYGRKLGGNIRAAVLRPQIEKKHKAWRDAAAGLSNELSLRAKSRLLVNRFKGTQYAGAEGTIRQVISKL